MLYEVSMFWDRRFQSVTASACKADDTHWVRIEAPDAAQTTIFVSSGDDANRLAALINEIVSDKPAAVCASADGGSHVLL